MNKSCPMNGVLPPLPLPSNIVYFFDWRYVDHGYLRWLGPDNQPIVPLMPAPSPLPPIHADSVWLPRGIRIETMPAQIDPEPCLTAKGLGEKLFIGGSVIRDVGRYRLFYEAERPDSKLVGHDKFLRLAESDDGMNWRFPEVSTDRSLGDRAGNVVMNPVATGYHGGGVFVDPHASPQERYKSVWLGYVTRPQLDRYRERWPDDVDPMAIFNEANPPAKGYSAWGVWGAVSPDGLRWTVRDEPLMIQHSDTFNVATWDAGIGTYVLYPRTWYYGRRAVGRATSDDFRHFSDLRQVIWPDGSMHPSDTWYTPGYVTMPGTEDYRLMFATLWSQLDDQFSPILHTSPDSDLWYRVPGAPMLRNGPTGSWYGCGGAFSNLVELPGDQLGSFFMGWHVPHKYPREFPGFGQCGWARWQRGRLAAVVAAEDAVFSLVRLKTNAKRAVLNFRTKTSGFIRIAMAGKDRRSFELCDPITGDELDRVVTWKGESDLIRTDDEPIQLSFQMRNAELFSVRFE